jgi:hypothetical protein
VSSFSENSLFEQNQSDSFYTTGSASRIGETPGSFSNSLINKTQIKVSFDVKSRIKMLPNSSSIYYFNVRSGNWNIPQNAVSDLSGFGSEFAVDSRAILENNLLPGVFLSLGTSGSTFVEDEKWFDNHGNALGSGSLRVHRVSTSDSEKKQKISEESFEDTYRLSPSSYSKFLNIDLPKSVQRNSAYDALSEDTFTLPIEEPFLIEKVVFEVPFCFGNGWFNDRTALTLMSSSKGNYTFGSLNTPFEDLVSDEISISYGDMSYTFVDIPRSGSTLAYNYGGPGITLSLVSQKNYGTGSIRDLVCRGFLTHDEDTRRDMTYVPIVERSSAGIHDWDNLWIQLTPLGIDTNETKVDATVSASYEGSKKFFSGSVLVKSDVEISNGVRIIHNRQLFGTKGVKDVTPYTWVTASSALDFISSSLDSINVSFGDSTLTGIDPFGRGMSGFSPSGGSIFGSEYVTADSSVLSRSGLIVNPSYVSGSKRNTILSTLSSSVTFKNPNPVSYGGGDYISYNMKIPCYYFVGSRRQSPYLIYPGEKLVLAASKNRPAILNFKAHVQNTLNLILGRASILSSSFLMNLGDPNGHDVQLDTGKINITFYGSYVREGKKYVP